MPSEEVLMAEKIGQLQKENEVLQQCLDTERNLVKHERRKRYFERMWLAPAVFLVVVGVLLLVGYPLYKTITADPHPTHCDITRTMSCSFQLNGRVPWRQDTDYGSFGTMAEALQAAEDLNCEVRSQR